MKCIGKCTTNNDGQTKVVWRAGKYLLCAFFLLCVLFVATPASAQAATGWKTSKGATYYYNSKGKKVTGYKKIGKYYYYFSTNGKMVKGYKKITEGKYAGYYYFNSKGRSTKGIYKVTGKDYKYYFNGDGTIAKNKVVEHNGKYYYCSSSGKVQTDCFIKVKGYRYYFGKNGAATTGWKTINGGKYYFNSKGRATIGLKKIGSYTYFFNDNGKMVTGYKKVTEGKNAGYYYFNSKGKSTKGIYQVPGKDYKYYFNGDGTIVKSKFKTVDGKLYFFTKSGKMCTDAWRNVGKEDLGGDPLYIHCNSKGVVSQGKTTFTRDGKKCTYYFDRTVENGYKEGIVKCSDNKYYCFDVSQSYGYLVTGFYTNFNGKKLYYFNPSDGSMKKSGTVTIPNTTATFKINSNGTVDIASGTKVKSSDSKRTKLIKYAFSQMYKPYGHPLYTSELMISLSKVKSYNCSGFVMRMYKEVYGTDVFEKNNDLITYCDDKNSLFTSQSNAKAGDIVFFNMDNCDKNEDDNGESWMTDNNGDGVCDRIHEDIVLGGNEAHVHHVGIYLGNGQIIHAAVGQGVMVQYGRESETFYQVGFGRVIK